MNSREIILKALYNIEENGEYFNLALSRALSNCNSQDRGFITEVLYGTVKNKLALDHIIAQFSSVKLKKMTPWVKNILRIGIYQIYYMDKIPHSAAVNESVKLAKKYAHAASVRFVNGVLRNVSRHEADISFPDKNDTAQYLSVKYSYPMWLTRKLLLQYGAEKCEKFMAESNKSHAVNLRVNPLKAAPKEAQNALFEEGVSSAISPLSPSCLNVSGRINISELSSYRLGYFSLQNISSYLAVLALDPREGEFIMDICSAPGGKACAAAELMKNRGEILAFDVHEHKIPLIEKSAERLGIKIIKAAAHDGCELMPEYINKADRVILDAPCMGIGVIHKKPDIKWTAQEEDVLALSRLQKTLLEVSSKYLKIGGTILYSTCSILREENEDVTAAFLTKHKEFKKLYEKQILTSENGESGFYICTMQRIK